MNYPKYEDEDENESLRRQLQAALDRLKNGWLDYMAEEVVEWHDREWPNPDGTPAETPRIVMKIMEELGECSGALVKHLQGRTDKNWISEAIKEYGDLMVCMMVLADRINQLGDPEDNLTMFSMFIERWEGPEGTSGQGVRDRRGSSYRA